MANPTLRSDAHDGKPESEREQGEHFAKGQNASDSKSETPVNSLCLTAILAGYMQSLALRPRNRMKLKP